MQGKIQPLIEGWGDILPQLRATSAHNLRRAYTFSKRKHKLIQAWYVWYVDCFNITALKKNTLTVLICIIYKKNNFILYKGFPVIFAIYI